MQDLHLPPYLTLERIGVIILPVLLQQALNVLSNPCGDQTVRARRTGGILDFSVRRRRRSPFIEVKRVNLSVATWRKKGVTLRAD